METFKDRLAQERIELNEKLEKLRTYIDKNMPGADQVQRSLLQVQLSAMITYSQVLLERLTWIDNAQQGEKAD